MSADWEKDLACKEHVNWVKLGCALNIAKSGIACLIQREIDTWYHKLLRTNPGLNFPCSCVGGKGGKCTRCVDWQHELKHHHRNKNPTLSNCNEKDWSSPSAGAWEVAKAYMSILGNRKSDVISAETTDLGGLLNILLMCKFLPSDKKRDETAKKVRDARNCWAHAPTQTVPEKELGNMLGDIEALLTDPLFNKEPDAIKALKNLQDMKREGIRNVKESELKILMKVRKTLLDEHQDLLEAQNLVKKCEILQSEGDELRKQIESLTERISQVEKAIKYFNDSLSRQCDFQNDINFIKLTNRVEYVEAAVEDLGGAFKEMGGKVEVLKKEMEKAQKREVIFNLPQKLKSFTGREKELKWLDDCFIKKLHDDEKSTGCTCSVISGLGGSGKTSLAVEFGWRSQTRDQFPGGIFWINVESDVNIEKSVTQILSPQLNNEEVSKSSNQQRINYFLSHLHKQESPWLLILDNADELDDSQCPDSLREILKWPWQTKNGNILLTSRQNKREIRNSMKQLHPNLWTLDCLSPEDATSFLINNCGIKDKEMEEKTRKDAHRLAQELGYLPLALKQAAAYISVSPLKCTIEAYLCEYQRVKGGILKKKTTQATSFENKERLAVHTTWIMNIKNIQVECPAAETMMKIAAFLGSNSVPVEVINPGEPEVEDAYKIFKEKCQSSLGRSDILQTLTKYSLFSHEDDNNVFGIHKLVQDTICNTMKIEERKVIAFASVAVLRKAPEIFELSVKGTVYETSRKWLVFLQSIRSSAATLKEQGKILELPVLIKECDSLIQSVNSTEIKMWRKYLEKERQYLEYLENLRQNQRQKERQNQLEELENLRQNQRQELENQRQYLEKERQYLEYLENLRQELKKHANVNVEAAPDAASGEAAPDTASKELEKHANVNVEAAPDAASGADCQGQGSSQSHEGKRKGERQELKGKNSKKLKKKE